MRYQGTSLFVISLALGGCVTTAGHNLDLLNPGSHDTWVCTGARGTTGPAGERQDASKVLVYPNMIPAKIEIDIPGHSLPCGGGASCLVSQQGSKTVISIKPAPGTRSDPTYSEILEFDKADHQLQFFGGGLDGGWGFKGKCNTR